MSETTKPAPLQPTVGITELKGFITRALESAGIPPEDATQVAALMAEADARGGGAHGVVPPPQDVKQILSGGIQPRPNIRRISETVCTGLVSRHNALEQIVMDTA